MKNTFLLLLLAMFFYSCGETQTNEFPMEYSLDGVKLISSAISNPRDESTMQRSSYTIDGNKRLLVRFESLDEHKDSIIVDEEHRVYMKIYLDQSGTSSLTEARNNIKVCPLTRNWMMLATWNKAHPFPGQSGPWSKAGGDFNEDECLTAEALEKDESDNMLKYDIGNWFIHNIRSRGKNFGFIVISESAVSLFGDAHSAYAPSISWGQLPSSSF